MAGQIPSPESLASWEDAFQHPLPVVRKLEQELRKNIDENREKLRSLVGASYRDLLGTAERIIEMNEQMHTVESTLGDVGRKCNARTMEQVGENREKMRALVDGREGEKRRVVAQTRLLQNCLTTIVRGVKRGGDALQIAKVLVLARLLFKSVSEHRDAPAIAQELRGRLAGARKKVMAYLEKVLAKAEGEKGVLGNGLCAYALITSSTPKEVLRYFLQVRLQQLESIADLPSEGSMLRMLELYSQTLLDSRELFPRRFAEALAQLAKAPLLRDDQLRLALELNIDAYSVWISPDIKTFTPWVRHEQLASTAVSEALAAWMSHAQKCVLEGLQEYLQSQDDARVVVSARQKIVSRYLALSSKLRGSNHREAIDGVRIAFLTRLKTLATNAGVVANVFQHEQKSTSGTTATSMSIWELATQDFDLSHGAVPFRDAIIQQRHGRAEAVKSAAQKLDTWTSNIHIILELVDEMRGSRWDDDIDLDLDDLDDNDVLMGNLSKKDPEDVLIELRKSTLQSVKSLANTVSSGSVEAEDAAFYLRVWREVDRRRRALDSRLELSIPTPNLQALYRNISQNVSRDAIESYINAARKQSYVPVKLWDGSPALPTQPMPVTFRFLVELQKNMSEVGEDIWSADAVFELKRVAANAVMEQLRDNEFTTRPVEGEDMTNGNAQHDDNDEDDDDADDAKGDTLSSTEASKAVDHNRLIQNLFEMLYLRRGFHAHSSEASNDLDSLVHTLRETAEVDDAMFERMQKSAGEYWKRTYLLFGLLAPGKSV